MKLPEFDNLPKAVALDLDGTLFNSREQLSVRNRRAVENCLSLGLPVIIATSRAERSVRRLVGSDLVDRCSLITLNGSIARGIDPLSGHLLESIPSVIAEKVVRFIIEADPSLRVTVEISGFEFGCNQRIDSETLWKISSATPDMVLSLKEVISRSPAKIAVNGLGRNVSLLAEKISLEFGDHISVIPSNGGDFLNIPSKKASKSGAIMYLLNAAGIKMKDVLAFGDDSPDIDMLSECGISVAMANAIPGILNIAEYQTASNDDDGVALVLERLIERASSIE